MKLMNKLSPRERGEGEGRERGGWKLVMLPKKATKTF